MKPEDLDVFATAEGVSVAIHVQPRAKRPGLRGIFGRALRIAVAAPPEKGRANRDVCALLAGLLGVPRRSVEIVAGRQHRSKRVEIEHLSESDFWAKIAPHLGEA